MIIKFRGEQSINKLVKNLKEIITDIQDRGGLEKEPVTVKDVEIGVLFGKGDDKSYLSVAHEGNKEVFTCIVQLDEKGNVKKKADNEKVSFMDDFEKAVARGEEFAVNTPIESVYDDKDLKLEHSEDCGDLVVNRYIHIDTKEVIDRYYRKGVLVGEAGYLPKEK